MTISRFLLSAFFLLGGISVHADHTRYPAEIETARAERIEELIKPDGWLTLIGLHFLKPGSTTIGPAADNQLLFSAGPAHLGTITLSDDGKVTFAAAPGTEVTIDGKPITQAELRAEAAGVHPTLVNAGTVTFFVIDRGGKKALRVRDSANPRRTHFSGIQYFPTDPSWRIEARWIPFETAKRVPVTNVLGQTSLEVVPGKAVFEHDGKTYELLPILEGMDQPLFFVIADATSGEETYQMRFLYTEWPKDGKLVLDFNLAENPPCAFTPFATCPLPPKGNNLPFALAAGEKKPAGSTH